MGSNDSGISLTPSYRQLSNEFRFESKRLQTFQCWPIDAPIESARVAKAGFYFTGRGYEVQCFACGGRISQWEYGDQAVAKHRQMNPSCPFLLNRSSNVPIQLGSETGNRNQPSEQNTRPVSTDSSTQRSETNRNVPFAASQHSDESPIIQQSRPLVPSSLPTHETQSPQTHVMSHHEWLALRSEDARLRTYSQFTKTHPSPSELAKAGFFYLGVSDHVQCVFCRRVIKDWESDDDPLREHTRLFPDCPFVLGLPVGNVPIGSSPVPSINQDATVIQPASEGFDVSPRFSPEMRLFARPDTKKQSKRVQDNIPDEPPGSRPHRSACRPDYKTQTSRLKSFEHWPSYAHLTPATLAEAGFFYTGNRENKDTVQCFHCGRSLQNWEPNDDPWIEHARWSPDCYYVETMKGEDFIKNAIENRPPILPSGPRDVSEAELRGLLESRIVRTVLGIGIDLSLVKMALKQKIRDTGESFTSVDSLLEATTRLQQTNERRQANEDSNYATFEWHEIRPSRNEASSEATESESDVEAAGLNTSSTTNNEIPRREHVPEPPQSATNQRVEPKAQLEKAKNSTEAAETTINEDAERKQMLEEENRRLKGALFSVCWETGKTENAAETAETTISEEKMLEEENRRLKEAIMFIDFWRTGKPENAAEAAETTILEETLEEENRRLKCTIKMQEEEKRRLKEENRRLKEARLCKVCLDEEVAIAYTPCGHSVTCARCATVLDQCPLCRKAIKGTFRTFFS